MVAVRPSYIKDARFLKVNLLKPTGHVTHQQFNLLKMKRNLFYIRITPYRAVNTFHHDYINQSVNAV